MNLDGYPDAVISSGTAGQYRYTIRQPRPAGFIHAVTFGTPAGSSNSSIAVGYLNVDGLPDIATPDHGVSLISTFLGTAGGASTYGLGTRTDYRRGGRHNHPAVASAFGDFNRDGFQDIAAVDSTTNDVFVWTGSSDGRPYLGRHRRPARAQARGRFMWPSAT